MERVVLPELLDVLPPQDQAALRSRRDLRRLNAWMNHPRILTRALRENGNGTGAPQIVELGAGDGHFLLSVAKRLRGKWTGAEAVLVDRLNALDPMTSVRLDQLGWQSRVEIAEASAWLRRADPHPARVVISNLFFHQFETKSLADMLHLAANSSRLIIALEPRRARLPKLVGRLLWLIGCGPVTRHDAGISIQAGFSAGELSALWPDKENWTLIERPAGLFSHLFIARRKK